VRLSTYAHRRTGIRVCARQEPVLRNMNAILKQTRVLTGIVDSDQLRMLLHSDWFVFEFRLAPQLDLDEKTVL